MSHEFLGDQLRHCSVEVLASLAAVAVVAIEELEVVPSWGSLVGLVDAYPKE